MNIFRKILPGLLLLQCLTAIAQQKLQSEGFIRRYGNLDNFHYYMIKDHKATVAFLGGSITNMKGWRDQTEAYLKMQYPDIAFTFINAGIPSLGSVPHVFRLQRDVLDKGKIDLLFVESAVNDHVNGTAAIQQQRALEGIIRHARSTNPYMDIVLMAFVDEDKIADYNNGKVPAEVTLHHDLAAYYKLPFINLAEEITRRIGAGEFNWKDDFKNLHPSPFGQELYAATIRTMLAGAKQKELKQPLAYTLPAPKDKTSYTQGHYVEVGQAESKGFALHTSWKPSDSVRTRPGFVNVPVLTAEKPGASLSFSFTGNAAGIAVLAGPDAGIISYSIDGKEEKEMNLYTQWSKSLHLPWYQVLADGLPEGKHTLSIRIADKKDPDSKGNACRIVYFLVNGK
ncbi:SGNH/GDSL hydrolase family protein [Sediminibacterium ginsengisoli]|uniref:Sialidase-1 n=1 Tax=Sediminibacterium ginsengisoli TaxID=413434 RepID=A0A1T4KVZ4_9BACT|nr:SGNH/GDSL hydrolase family protein [Sediminibacterium ginsengisoli]SJZ46605.1 sialidase-1 [Sediminibacterium ginsengisoli]